MRDDAICILGDSVLLGIVFDEGAGRYSLLRDGALTVLTRKLGRRVSNLSRMGQTSIEAHGRFKDAVEGGLRGSELLIELGGNDCDMDWSSVARNPDGEHTPRVSIDAFRDALQGIISLARGNGFKPVLASLPPLDPLRFLEWVAKDEASKANILRFLGDAGRIYRWHELYNLELSRVASEEGADLVGLREGFLSEKGYQALICRDGIHPNLEGHRLMKGILYSYFSGIGSVA